MDGFQNKIKFKLLVHYNCYKISVLLMLISKYVEAFIE